MDILHLQTRYDPKILADHFLCTSIRLRLLTSTDIGIIFVSLKTLDEQRERPRSHAPAASKKYGLHVRRASKPSTLSTTLIFRDQWPITKPSKRSHAKCSMIARPSLRRSITISNIIINRGYLNPLCMPHGNIYFTMTSTTARTELVYNRFCDNRSAPPPRRDALAH